MGTNWDEKMNPESLSFLKNQPNIALPTVFSDALSYYEQISKIYAGILEIIEKVNNSVDLSHEAVDTANAALAGVDAAKKKANSKLCVYKGVTTISETVGQVISLGSLEVSDYKSYFVLAEDDAPIVPTVCVDYRNGFFGLVTVDAETEHTIVTSLGLGLDITNVVKVIEQTFSTSQQAQARTNIGAASQSDMSTAQGDISTLQGQYTTLNGEVVKHTVQTLSDAQKVQARTNIGAANASDVSTLDGDAVKYVSQSKTDAEKTQARTNIGAPSVAYVDAKPHVPAVASGDVGKVLTADANNGYAWETPLAISGTADVLVCNFAYRNGDWVCDKTYTQINQAVMNDWPVFGVIGFSDYMRQIGIVKADSGAYVFEANIEDKCYRASIATDNAITVTVTNLSSTLIITSTDLDQTSGSVSGVTAEVIYAAIKNGNRVILQSETADGWNPNRVTYRMVSLVSMSEITISGTSSGWHAIFTDGSQTYELTRSLSWTRDDYT